MLARYFIYNGKILDYQTENRLSQLFLNNYFFLSEGMWFCKGAIPLFENHIELIHEKITDIGKTIPEFLSNTKEIHRLCLRLINKNKAFYSGQIQLKIVWQEEAAHYMLVCFPEKEGTFQMSKKALLLTYSEIKKQSQSPFSQYDFGNYILWEHLSFMAKKNKKDGLIILNETNNVTEFEKANIYFIKGNTLYTPSAETGCYIDPIRCMVLKSALNLDFKVLESPKITQQLILTMNEAFVASELNGFQKIMGIDEKRFLHIKTVALYEELINQLTASKS